MITVLSFGSIIVSADFEEYDDNNTSVVQTAAYDDEYYDDYDTIISLKYVGCDCIFMAVEIVVYLLILFIFENQKNIFEENKKQFINNTFFF